MPAPDLSEVAKLNFDDGITREAGQNVSGHVEINVEKAEFELESIKVVLKGVVKNVVTRQNGASLFPTPNRYSEILAQSEATLWTNASTSNEKEIEAPLVKTFSLALPKNCPATFSYKSKDPGQSSALKYSIKVVGLRKGFLKSNLKHKVYFPVVSAHAINFDDRLALVQGWGDRQWFNLVKNHSVHKNLVGGRLAETAVNFRIPALDSYPIGYPIPYEITASITYDKNQSSSGDQDKANPVALPSPQAITFNLMKYHRIQAYGKLGVPHDDIGRHNIACLLDTEKVKVERKPLELIKDSDDAKDGKWRQEMRIVGHFVNNDCGDYLLRALKVNYTLDLTIPFQGLMNNIIYITPIKFSRGPVDDFVANSDALSHAVAASDLQVDLPAYVATPKLGTQDSANTPAIPVQAVQDSEAPRAG